MTYVIAALLILAVAMAIALPLWTTKQGPAARATNPETERLEREKAAALLAIREARLDKAMGKLSEEDYAALRGFYELRAISAMTQLDAGNAQSSAHRADGDHCAECGASFTDASGYCGRCGSEQPAARL